MVIKIKLCKIYLYLNKSSCFSPMAEKEGLLFSVPHEMAKSSQLSALPTVAYV